MGIEKIKGEKKRKKKEEILSEKSLIILWPICMKCTSKVKLSLMVEEKTYWKGLSLLWLLTFLDLLWNFFFYY